MKNLLLMAASLAFCTSAAAQSRPSAQPAPEAAPDSLRFVNVYKTPTVATRHVTPLSPAYLRFPLPRAPKQHVLDSLARLSVGRRQALEMLRK